VSDGIIDGPIDKQWEVVDESIYEYLYVQRVGRDADPQRIQPEISFPMERDGEQGRAVARFLADRLNKLDRFRLALTQLAEAAANLRNTDSDWYDVTATVMRMDEYNDACVHLRNVEQAVRELLNE
jgi:hypothetical protein